MTFLSPFSGSTPPLDKAPFYWLAEEVCSGRMSLEEARRQATNQQYLDQMNPAVIEQYDEAICALSLLDPCRASVLAEFNRAIAVHHGDQISLGNCESTLGWLYREQNQLDKALAHSLQSLQIFDSVPDSGAMLAQVRRDIGEIYERQGDLVAARGEFESMRQIAVELRRADLESEALNRRGKIYLLEGKAKDALTDFESALALSRNPVLERSMETALGNRGLAYQLLGHLAEAERDHREALAISRKIAEQIQRDNVTFTEWTVAQDSIGRHMADLGGVLLARGQLNAAEQQLTPALEIARQMSDRAGEQQRHGTLGNLYQAMPQHRRNQHDQHSQWLSEAIKHHQQAIAIALERRDERSRCTYLLNLGNDYSALGRFDDALGCYDQAFALAEKHAIEDLLWRILYVRGNLRVAQKQSEIAYGHYADAVEQAERQRNEIDDIDLKMHFWHDRVALYKRAALCCLDLKRPDRLRLALTYTEQSKARYLNDRLKQSIGKDESTQPDPADDIQAVIDHLDPDTAVVVFNVTEQETLVFIVANPPAGHPEIEVGNGWQTSEEGRIRARRVATFDLYTLQRLLVEIDASGKVSGGYLVDYYPERQVRAQAGVEKRELAFEEQHWSNGPLKETTDFIYTSILGIVDQALTSLPIKQVIFMPNLGLALLPLHACSRSNSAVPDYFLDHYTVRYAPSFRLLRHCQQLARREMDDDANIYAVSDPTDGLLGAEIEIRLIGHLFPAAGQKLIFAGDKDNRATPQAVIATAPKYSFIHFACHGIFNLRNLLQSALELAADDQDVPVERLTLDMILRDIKRLPHTRLVVMSACETGMADPGNLADEYFSLPAGFLLAGAPTVVASLWLANDLSTILLMSYFYNQYITQGLAPAAALCVAQVWLRDLTLAAWGHYDAEIRSSAPSVYILLERERKRLLKKHGNDERAQQIRPFAQPYYWAAFTVIGV